MSTWRGLDRDESGRNGDPVLNVEGRILTGGLGVEGEIAFQKDRRMCTQPDRGRKSWLCLEQK